MTLELLQEIAEEAQKQGKIDGVMNGFWMLFSWTGGDK